MTAGSLGKWEKPSKLKWEKRLWIVASDTSSPRSTTNGGCHVTAITTVTWPHWYQLLAWRTKHEFHKTWHEKKQYSLWKVTLICIHFLFCYYYIIIIMLYVMTMKLNEEILQVIPAVSVTGTISATDKNQQVLDKLQVERERGITVKAQTASLIYEYKGDTYLLNLIDTPVRRNSSLTFSIFVWNTITEQLPRQSLNHLTIIFIHITLVEDGES